MVKILTLNSPPEIEKEAEKENFFKKLWESFKSLDKFTKASILYIFLITISIFALKDQYVEFRQRAADSSSPAILNAAFGKNLVLNSSVSPSYFTISANNVLDIAQPFTIEGLIKINSFGKEPLGGNHVPFIARGFAESPRQNFNFSINEQPDGTHKISFINYSSYGKPLVSLEGITDVKAGKWYHVAVSQDNTLIRKIFLNGRLENKMVVTDEILNLGDTLVLGAAWDADNGSRNFADAVFDEVRISLVDRYSSDFNIPQSPLSSSDQSDYILWHFDGDYSNSTFNGIYYDPNIKGNTQFLDSDFFISP